VTRVAHAWAELMRRLGYDRYGAQGGDWRTFRVDRLATRTPTGPRFAPRQPPHGNVAAYLAHQLSSQVWPYRATVTLHKPAGAVADRISPGTGVVEAVDDRACLEDALRTQATRCLRARQPH
jgi:WYL domain-containing protein